MQGIGLCPVLSRQHYRHLCLAKQTLFLLPSLRFQVEWDAECQRVLKSRIADGYLDDGPVFSDAQSYTPSKTVLDSCEGLIGGFPCQVLWIQSIAVLKDKFSMFLFGGLLCSIVYSCV